MTSGPSSKIRSRQPPGSRHSTPTGRNITFTAFATISKNWGYFAATRNRTVDAGGLISHPDSER
jgi:hypothetical protein